jgi:hypothetical protein
MQLCFVSVHGPRETYFVDEPRKLLLANTGSYIFIQIHVSFFFLPKTEREFCFATDIPNLRQHNSDAASA